jgi:hypothetical protein
MTKIQKGNYIMFPLSYNSELSVNPEAMVIKALIYGLYKYSVECDYSDEAIAETLSNMSNNPEFEQVLGGLTEYEEILAHLEAYDGFRSEVEQLARVVLTLDFFELDFKCLEVTEKGELLYANRNKREPHVPISVQILLNASRSKQERLLDYAVYFALRSMLGEKSVWFTSMELVMARAFGYSAIDRVPDEIKAHEWYRIATDRNKYKQQISLKKRLQMDFHVQTFADHTRGFAFAIGEQEALQRCINFIGERKLKAESFKQMAKEARLTFKAKRDKIRQGIYPLMGVNG